MFKFNGTAPRYLWAFLFLFLSLPALQVHKVLASESSKSKRQKSSGECAVQGKGWNTLTTTLLVNTFSFLPTRDFPKYVPTCKTFEAAFKVFMRQRKTLDLSEFDDDKRLEAVKLYINSSLTHLDLGGTKCRISKTEAAEMFAKLRSATSRGLTTLLAPNLSFIDLTNVGNKLRYVDLSYTPFDDAGMITLANSQKDLRVLLAYGTSISIPSLEYLSSFPHLVEFGYDGSRRQRNEFRDWIFGKDKDTSTGFVLFERAKFLEDEYYEEQDPDENSYDTKKMHEAVATFRSAAVKGYPLAQIRMGKLCERYLESKIRNRDELGIANSNEEARTCALAWYKLASKQGYAEATQRLYELDSHQKFYRLLKGKSILSKPTNQITSADFDEKKIAPLGAIERRLLDDPEVLERERNFFLNPMVPAYAQRRVISGDDFDPPEGLVWPLDRHEDDAETANILKRVDEAERLRKTFTAEERKEFRELFAGYLEKVKSNEPHDLFVLGLMYENGLGVKIDKPLGRSWIRTAAYKGDARAQSYMVDHSKEFNLRRSGINYPKLDSVYWAKKSALKGLGLGIAQAISQMDRDRYNERMRALDFEEPRTLAYFSDEVRYAMKGIELKIPESRLSGHFNEYETEANVMQVVEGEGTAGFLRLIDQAFGYLEVLPFIGRSLLRGDVEHIGILLDNKSVRIDAGVHDTQLKARWQLIKFLTSHVDYPFKIAKYLRKSNPPDLDRATYWYQDAKKSWDECHVRYREQQVADKIERGLKKIAALRSDGKSPIGEPMMLDSDSESDSDI